MGNNRSPVWSPDGTQIAFASDVDGDQEIFIMNADGSNVQQITHNTVGDQPSYWAANPITKTKTQILPNFQVDVDGVNSTIFVQNTSVSSATMVNVSFVGLAGTTDSELNIPASGSTTIDSQNVAGLASGTYVVTLTSDQVIGSVLHQERSGKNDNLAAMTGINVASSNQVGGLHFDLHFASVIKESTIVLQNMEDSAATVVITFYDLQGM